MRPVKSAMSAVSTSKPVVESKKIQSPGPGPDPHPQHCRILRPPPASFQSPPLRPDSRDDIEVTEPSGSVELTVISIFLLPEDCKACLKEGELSYKAMLSNSIFGCPKAMQALAWRLATLSLEPQDLIVDTQSTNCHNKGKRDQVVTALGIGLKIIVPVMMTPGYSSHPRRGPE